LIPDQHAEFPFDLPDLSLEPLQVVVASLVVSLALSKPCLEPVKFDLQVGLSLGARKCVHHRHATFLFRWQARSDQRQSARSALARWLTLQRRA